MKSIQLYRMDRLLIEEPLFFAGFIVLQAGSVTLIQIGSHQK